MSNEIAKVQKLKDILTVNSVKEQFENSLNENAGSFVASIIDLYSSDNYLQQCDPKLVIMEALKAATLKLPINKQLGFAYIVPYKKNKIPTPQFQLGYKGYIQLAMRTGQYKFLNAGIVYEGIKVKRNYLTGETAIAGEPVSEKVIGYFAYMELLNGFSKTVYMKCSEVEAHAKRYSKSYNRSTSAWKTNFDEMAMKTVTRILLSKYGIMSVDMISALTSDIEDAETATAKEIEEKANKEVIDVAFTVDDDTEQKGQEEVEEGPGF